MLDRSKQASEKVSNLDLKGERTGPNPLDSVLNDPDLAFKQGPNSNCCLNRLIQAQKRRCVLMNTIRLKTV